jgi:uncharacterized protein (TIGR03435 family)
MKAALAFLVYFATWAVVAKGQSFEVISIKPNSQTTFGRSIKFTLSCANGRFVSRNIVVKGLIAWAYGGTPVFNVPDWAEHEETTYDVDATSPRGTSEDQCRAMLKNAFVDRFQLRTHTEMRQRSSDYSLVIDKDGTKLKPSVKPGSPHVSTGPGGLSARNASMNVLATLLTQKLGGIVKNSTGLEGMVFDFNLDFAPTDPNEVDPLHAEIFEALPRQLGLRLLKRHEVESFQAVIVDGIDKPSPN